MKAGPFSITTTSILGTSFFRLSATMLPAKPAPTIRIRLGRFGLAAVWPLVGFTRSVAAKPGRMVRKWRRLRVIDCCYLAIRKVGDSGVPVC